jgi:4-hydroxybutyryl-CoA dehydratase/vinylacetyl-CoA-Delta-isomerase
MQLQEGGSMGIRTPAEYKESLRDNRVIYFRGEKVADVTTHPVLKVAVEQGAMDYILAEDSNYSELFSERMPDGELVSFVYLPNRSAADLLRRREIIQISARTCFGLPAGAKFTGIDGLNALSVVCPRIDRKFGNTEYGKRIEAYRKMLQKEDPAIAIAMTDVKGDRAVRPSRQQDPDMYVRVVEERPEGIVVRGAKTHITMSPCANELIVTPCRAMKEEDKAYAVAFAVQLDAEGLIMISGGREEIEEGNIFDAPLAASSYTADATVIFEDVLIPWDRVFLNQEWEFAGQIVYMFGNFHRLSADAYKYAELEVLTGIAALMAEYNGIEKAPHVVDKLSWLTMYTEGTEALGRAACENCVNEPDSEWVYPNQMYSNIAKFFFAENFHQAIKHIQDITGGIGATIFSSKDYENEEIRGLLDKYFAGKEGVPTENRIKAIKLAKDFGSNWHAVTTLHAEGSLSAQRMSIYALADFERYKAAAKRAARIEDGSKFPMFDSLPLFSAQK